MAKIDVNAGPVSTPIAPTMATAEDFGSSQQLQQAGQDIMDLSGKLIQAKVNADNRKDTINRARLKNQYTADLENEYQRRLTEVDMTDPAQAEDFANWASNKGMEYLDQHDGTPDSKARLSVIFDDLRGGTTRQFSREVVAAGRRFIDDEWNTSKATIANDAAISGDIEEGWSALEMSLNDMSSAMTPDELRDRMRDGQQAVVSAVYGRAMSSYDLDSAAEILDNPDVKGIMDPKQYSAMKMDLAKERFAQKQGAIQAEADIQYLMKTNPGMTREAVIEKFGPELAKKRAGVSDSTRVTTAQKVRELEVLLGRPATEAEVKAIAGAKTKDEDTLTVRGKESMLRSVFPEASDEEVMDMIGVLENESQTQAQVIGRLRSIYPDMTPEQAAQAARIDFTPEALAKTSDERSLKTMETLAQGFANDNLTDDEFRRFDSAVTSYIKPVLDEFGQIIQVKPLPSFVRDAYRARNMEPPSANDVMVGEGPQRSLQPGVEPPSETLFDLAKHAVGVESGVRRFLGKVPFIGDKLYQAQPMQQQKAISAAAQLNSIVREVTKRKQNSPKYAEGERAALEKEQDLLAQGFDTVGSYQNRVIGIADATQAILDAAERFKATQWHTLTSTMRAALTEDVFRARMALVHLGAPPLIKDERQLEGLPPGTVFRIPRNDGGWEFGRIPEDQGE